MRTNKGRTVTMRWKCVDFFFWNCSKMGLNLNLSEHFKIKILYSKTQKIEKSYNIFEKFQMKVKELCDKTPVNINKF